MITVESTDDGVRVTVPKGEVPPERLSAFLDWLRFESLAQQSRLSESEADRLAEEAKADWWARNREHRIPPAQS